MCLAIPGKVISKINKDGLLMGQVDYSGIVNEVCLEYCSKVNIGEYVIVHAGFAISIVDEESARETIQIYMQMISENSNDTE